MRKYSNFVQVSDLNLAKRSIIDLSSIDPVKLVDLTLSVELLDDTDGFHADGSLSLLSTSSTMVSTIDTRVCCDRVIEIVSSFDRGLSKVDIGADPEVWASLELGKECDFIDASTTGGVDEHSISLHLA